MLNYHHFHPYVTPTTFLPFQLTVNIQPHPQQTYTITNVARSRITLSLRRHIVTRVCSRSISSSYCMSGFYYLYINYCGNSIIIPFCVIFCLYNILFYTKYRKNLCFFKLDMIRLLFCVLINILPSLCIICVLSCYKKLFYLCWNLSNHYFHIQIWCCIL